MKKRGISLIVLVITIIVMIIIATAIILRLSSSNLKEKANTAKDISDLANAEHVVTVALGEWELETVEGYSTFSAYAEDKLAEEGYPVTGNGSYAVSETGTLHTRYVDSANQEAIIPEGFVVSGVSSENKVATGLVIYEGTDEVTDVNVDVARETRNQYVWVPVDDFSNFKTTTTYTGTTITSPGNGYVEPITALTPNVTDISLYMDEIEQYDAMRQSVKDHGGFYIARYEAGLPSGKTQTTAKKDGTDKPLSVKNVDAWNYIGFDNTWTKSDKTVTSSIEFGNHNKNGAALIARKAVDSTSVTSHLLYGVQWDAAIRFITTKGIADTAYATAGSTTGNFSGSLTKTGMEDSYARNNIYDMAGNVWEFTYEVHPSSSSYGSRVRRGGSYLGDTASEFASGRSWLDPDFSNSIAGFRVALTLK